MKKIMCTLMTVFSVALLASCNKGGGGSGDEFAPSMDTDTQCSIRIVGDYDNFPELMNRFKEFNAYYPNVQLNYQKISGNYKEMIATVLEGNDKPNIFFSSTWMLEDEAYASIVNHMEDLSDSSLKINLSCIRQGLIKSVNNLMVPLFGRSYGMLVNNDLFEKEGLEVPTTWNELLSVCSAFREKGYTSPLMGYSKKEDNCGLMTTIAYPAAIASIANSPDAIELANKPDPRAGEYMRAAFNAVAQLKQNNCFNLTECDSIDDNYNLVIMRFFEGDVPMMVCADDTPSGTRKREERSQAFIDHPFSYSYNPIPLTDRGGYFIDTPSKLLSVNKYCENLDMTNEFMRFLVTNKALNAMAYEKNLLSSTKEISFESIYAPFGDVAPEYTYSPEGLGITGTVKAQIRKLAFKVATGAMTVDEAVAAYGE